MCLPCVKYIAKKYLIFGKFCVDKMWRLSWQKNKLISFLWCSRASKKSNIRFFIPRLIVCNGCDSLCHHIPSAKPFKNYSKAIYWRNLFWFNDLYFFISLFIFRIFLTCRVVFYGWPSCPKCPCRVENIVIILSFAKRKYWKGWFEMMPGRKWMIIIWSISKSESIFLGVQDLNRIILPVNMRPIISIDNDFIILKFRRKFQKKVFNALTPGWKWTIFWSI